MTDKINKTISTLPGGLYPHVQLIVDGLAYDEVGHDAPAVIDHYQNSIYSTKSTDPDCELLRNELATILEEPDNVLIAITGEPESHEWESGTPTLSELKRMFTSYIREIDSRNDRWPFERVLDAVSQQLDPKEATRLCKYVRDYLHHDEPELAFEGLVSTLRKFNVQASPSIRRDLGHLAQILGATDYPDGKVSTGRQISQIGIRPATAADAAAIANIHMTSRAATMPYLPPQKRNHEQVTSWVKDVLLKTCHVWVAERDEVILGYAALDGDMLEHLYLHPDARRQGIGTLLLNEVKHDSPGGVSLHVFQANTDARKFYEHHGFVVVGTTDGSGNMENLPDMTMRWEPAGTRWA